ncbi:MAG: DUF3014 domain-containing protein [Acidobacteriota bacterium]|nr:DUF3014 domain-containing protein [Acidobacteriota bacterium]
MKPIVIALAVVVVVIGGFLVWRSLSQQPVSNAPEPVQVEEEPLVDQYTEGYTEDDTGESTAPVPEPEPDPEPPTDMEGGDTVVRERIPDNADPGLREVLDYDYLISKTVTATDLIYREKNPMSQLPFLIQPDRLRVERRGTKLYLAKANYQRYEKWIKVFESLDPDTIVNTYQFLHPLFSRAFEELGMQGRDWETTLAGAYDKVAAMEVPQGDLELVAAGKTYIFADTELEELPPAHKALLRMGPKNADRLKKKLAAFKTALGQ